MLFQRPSLQRERNGGADDRRRDDRVAALTRNLSDVMYTTQISAALQATTRALITSCRKLHLIIRCATHPFAQTTGSLYYTQVPSRRPRHARAVSIAFSLADTTAVLSDSSTRATGTLQHAAQRTAIGRVRRPPVPLVAYPHPHRRRRHGLTGRPALVLQLRQRDARAAACASAERRQCPCGRAGSPGAALGTRAQRGDVRPDAA